jgi:hypothetical protein
VQFLFYVKENLQWSNSNKLIMIFFANLGSKYHNILIFFLNWGSSTIHLVHHTHTQSFHVTPIVVFNSRLDWNSYPLLLACQMKYLEVIGPNESHYSIAWTLNCGRTKITFLSAWLSDRLLCQRRQFRSIPLQNHQLQNHQPRQAQGISDALCASNALVLAPELMANNYTHCNI